MATLFVGDVQGCRASLEQLLDKVRFDPLVDRLFLVGDVVNRGPDSAGVLRLVMSLGGAARMVLGNHDLHLLAVAAGAQPMRNDDTFSDVLEDSARESMLDFLRRQPLLISDTESGSIVVHAGLLPGWSLSQAIGYADEVSRAIRTSCDGSGFLFHLYGNQPAYWSSTLTGWDRLRLLTNVFTRLRYCSRDGHIELNEKGPPQYAPADLFPWFELFGNTLLPRRVVFGHWSSLGLFSRQGFIGLDTGCVWGGELTAVRVEAKTDNIEFVSCACS